MAGQCEERDETSSSEGGGRPIPHLRWVSLLTPQVPRGPAPSPSFAGRFRFTWFTFLVLLRLNILYLSDQFCPCDYTFFNPYFFVFVSVDVEIEAARDAVGSLKDETPDEQCVSIQ